MNKLSNQISARNQRNQHPSRRWRITKTFETEAPLRTRRVTRAYKRGTLTRVDHLNGFGQIRAISLIDASGRITNLNWERDESQMIALIEELV